MIKHQNNYLFISNVKEYSDESIKEEKEKKEYLDKVNGICILFDIDLK